MLSVIICTHNPRPAYFKRVVEALKAQTLSREQWELLLIDNASETPLATAWDLSWHPHSRHVREEDLGLTPARMRGIKEAQGEILVFVDDDNVLDPDYLKVAVELMLSQTWIGALGGNCIGEFESKPEAWAESMFLCLALVNVKQSSWACYPGTKALEFAPCGAGMVIRKSVALHYAELAANAPIRRGLDRKGNSLASAGDSDMALCACKLGLAVGRFPQLRLTHLMPAKRLERAYLLRLKEEMEFSHALLRFVWDGSLPDLVMATPSRSERIFRSYQAMRNRRKGDPVAVFSDEVKAAALRGLTRAAEALQSQRNDSTRVIEQPKRLQSAGIG